MNGLSPKKQQTYIRYSYENRGIVGCASPDTMPRLTRPTTSETWTRGAWHQSVQILISCNSSNWPFTSYPSPTTRLEGHYGTLYASRPPMKGRLDRPFGECTMSGPKGPKTVWLIRLTLGYRWTILKRKQQDWRLTILLAFTHL